MNNRENSMNSYFVRYMFPDGGSAYFREFLLGAVRYTHDIEEAKTFRTWRSAMFHLAAHGRIGPESGRSFQICNFADELVSAFAQEDV
jgi:hypothetical protein